MADIEEMDKCEAIYPFRMPEITKRKVDKLSPSLKKKLNLELLLTTARILHESDFDPSLYLKSE